MSRELFNLAVHRINTSSLVGDIYLESGPHISNVRKIGVVYKKPTLAWAEIYGSNTIFYFQIKDLIGFEADGDTFDDKDDSEEDFY